MAAITMAMGQGPNTPSYILAQTFQPLIHMAVGLQLTALQGAGGGGGAAPLDQMILPATGTEYYQQPPPAAAAEILKAKPGEDATEEYVPERIAAGKKRKEDGEAGREGLGQQKTSNRRRKASSRFAEYVSIDDL
jgi:hypothetical protein